MERLEGQSLSKCSRYSFIFGAFGSSLTWTRSKLSMGYSTPQQQDAGNVPPSGRKRGQMSAPAVRSGLDSSRNKARRVELDSSHSNVSSVAVDTLTADVESQSYLELPVHIPSTHGKEESQQRKVVYLRDPNGRLWPLLYHGKIFLKVLTENWKRFCEANNIKPGDQCSFQVEDRMLCNYSVDIVRKI